MDSITPRGARRSPQGFESPCRLAAASPREKRAQGVLRASVFRRLWASGGRARTISARPKREGIWRGRPQPPCHRALQGQRPRCGVLPVFFKLLGRRQPCPHYLRAPETRHEGIWRGRGAQARDTGAGRKSIAAQDPTPMFSRAVSGASGRVLCGLRWDVVGCRLPSLGRFAGFLAGPRGELAAAPWCGRVPIFAANVRAAFRGSSAKARQQGLASVRASGSHRQSERNSQDWPSHAATPPTISTAQGQHICKRTCGLAAKASAHGVGDWGFEPFSISSTSVCSRYNR